MELSWAMEGVPMPHRGKRTDLRREWALCALRLLFDKIDADEEPIGMSITTKDSGGVYVISALKRGDDAPERHVVTDLEALTNGVEKGTIALLYSPEWYRNGATEWT